MRLDRHNNGGFSSGERAQGNPCRQGAIETCCTIAWTALSVEMLRLTCNSIVADELELTTLNSILGLHSPNGRWVTYNTPMDGVRKASAHEIVFQARAGLPELNCCSVNGPRGLGMISDWALMQSSGGLLLNWYGPGTVAARLPSGNTVTLEQRTGYPREGNVRIKLDVHKREAFPLKLRIPHWSRSTRVRLNGRAVEGVLPGQYLALARTWRRGDTVHLDLDLSLRFWVGERECAGRVSVYRGPLLLAYDRRFNEMDPDQLPSLSASVMNMKGKVASTQEWLAPLLLMDFPASDGRSLRLCDFASAGIGGSPYRSWLPIDGVNPALFSKENPLRCSRPF